MLKKTTFSTLTTSKGVEGVVIVPLKNLFFF